MQKSRDEIYQNRIEKILTIFGMEKMVYISTGNSPRFDPMTEFEKSYQEMVNNYFTKIVKRNFRKNEKFGKNLQISIHFIRRNYQYPLMPPVLVVISKLPKFQKSTFKMKPNQK